MRKLKTYERFFNESKYNDGDYVIVELYDKLMFCRIVSFNQVTNFYQCKELDGDIFWAREYQIKREMTTEEIKKYEIEKDSKKYNL